MFRPIIFIPFNRIALQKMEFCQAVLGNLAVLPVLLVPDQVIETGYIHFMGTKVLYVYIHTYIYIYTHAYIQLEIIRNHTSTYNYHNTYYTSVTRVWSAEPQGQPTSVWV